MPYAVGIRHKRGPYAATVRHGAKKAQMLQEYHVQLALQLARDKPSDVEMII